jgi:hypothetical protein
VVVVVTDGDLGYVAAAHLVHALEFAGALVCL